MYNNFHEYYQAYVKKYNKEFSKNIENKKFYNVGINTFVLAIPFAFVAILTLFINTNTNYNSQQINSMYSEKYTNNDFAYGENLITTSVNYDKRSAINDSLLSNYNILSDSRIKKINFNFTENSKTTDQTWKKNFSKKKIEFIETLLPLISFQNQQIIIERNRLYRIRDYLQNQKTLSEYDMVYLKNLADRYSINFNNIHKIDLVAHLLESINIIPSSIVLAQAINESGWGTSRFAKEYNALFGQYTYDETKGIIPYEREVGKKHLIKNFSSIDKSVESYFTNINTHYAYKEFRKIRTNIKKENFDIKLLTQALNVYAADEYYVQTLNSIIDSNNLTQFDDYNFSVVNS